jgi:ribosomal protein RSM22 (predicted rRNA methylase)
VTELDEAISSVLLSRRVAGADLARSAAELSTMYRQGGGGRPRLSPAAVAAYLATRLPATYGAARRCFESVAGAMPGFEPARMLDLGAGPGPAVWAACEIWPSIAAVELLERDPAMIEVGQELAPKGAGRDGSWAWAADDMVARSRRSFGEAGCFDLVTAAYCLGELAPEVVSEVAMAAWRSCGGCFVVIEPGTPGGFALVRELRSRLIEAGASVAAPCPSEQPCPVRGDDWCHFAARIGRSALHRQLKGGARSFEDEKFSYLAVTRLPVARPAGRVVRRPVRRRRLVQLVACEGDRLSQVSVGQSQPGYRAVVDLEWGDGIGGHLPG